MKKVISIVMNNFKNDTRVLKEAITLKNNSFDVMVFALHDGKSNLKEYDSVSNIFVRRIILKTKNFILHNILFQPFYLVNIVALPND